MNLNKSESEADSGFIMALCRDAKPSDFIVSPHVFDTHFYASTILIAFLTIIYIIWLKVVK